MPYNLEINSYMIDSFNNRGETQNEKPSTY